MEIAIPYSYTLSSASASILLNQYLTYIDKVQRLAITTVNNRKHILQPFIKHIDDDIKNVTLQDVDAFFIHRSNLIKDSSLNSEKQAVRSFFEYCQYYRNIKLQFDARAIKRVKCVPPKIRVFTPQEVAIVLNGVDNEQDALTIALLYETGMRIGEIIDLCVEDITGTQIRVRGKGQKDRPVYVTHESSLVISDYINRNRLYAGRLLRPQQVHYNHPHDAYISAYALRDRIKRIFAQNGYEIHPHQLRHSFAVNALQNGMDVRTLQKILGHANLDTTMRYLQITDTHTEEQYHKHIKRSMFRYSIQTNS